MFKRVQKRARKLEKEEEHGLDSEMKEVLGLQSTDSEESEFSSSESGSDSKEESRDAASDAEDKEDEGEGLESLEDEGSDGEEGSEDESEFPLMSVTEAVSDPLYLVSIDPDVRACILCPGKLLKNTRMADVHKSSKVRDPCPVPYVAWFKQLIALRHITGDLRVSLSLSRMLALGVTSVVSSVS